MAQPRRLSVIVLWIVTIFLVLAFGILASLSGSLMREPEASALPSAASPAPPPTAPAVLERLYPVPAFSLTDQDGKLVTQAQLRGHVWVAAFIFTRCQGPCPLITRNMATVLQADLAGTPVRLVSYSLDPTHDTPAVLKTYAQTHQADESRWQFLTGPATSIYDLAKGMKVTAVPALDGNPIAHSTKLVLIDPDGWIRGYYDSADTQSLHKLAADAISLTPGG